MHSIESGCARTPGGITLCLGVLHAPMRFLKCFCSTDHKVIGLLYAVTSLCFLLIGFALVLIMRWQLAYPGEPLPLIGEWLGVANAPGGVVLPEFYNQLGAMLGTIMVFLGVVPLARSSAASGTTACATSTRSRPRRSIRPGWQRKPRSSSSREL